MYLDMCWFVVDLVVVVVWLLVDVGMKDSDYIYMVDLNGNLMMCFLKDLNFSKIKLDVMKLLKWLSIG